MKPLARAAFYAGYGVMAVALVALFAYGTLAINPERVRLSDFAVIFTLAAAGGLGRCAAEWVRPVTAPPAGGRGPGPPSPAPP